MKEPHWDLEKRVHLLEANVAKLTAKCKIQKGNIDLLKVKGRQEIDELKDQEIAALNARIATLEELMRQRTNTSAPVHQEIVNRVLNKSVKAVSGPAHHEPTSEELMRQQTNTSAPVDREIVNRVLNKRVKPVSGPARHESISEDLMRQQTNTSAPVDREIVNRVVNKRVKAVSGPARQEPISNVNKGIRILNLVEKEVEKEVDANSADEEEHSKKEGTTSKDKEVPAPAPTNHSISEDVDEMEDDTDYMPEGDGEVEPTDRPTQKVTDQQKSIEPKVSSPKKADFPAVSIVLDKNTEGLKEAPKKRGRPKPTVEESESSSDDSSSSSGNEFKPNKKAKVQPGVTTVTVVRKPRWMEEDYMDLGKSKTQGTTGRPSPVVGSPIVGKGHSVRGSTPVAAVEDKKSGKSKSTAGPKSVTGVPNSGTSKGQRGSSPVAGSPPPKKPVLAKKSKAGF